MKRTPLTICFISICLVLMLVFSLTETAISASKPIKLKAISFLPPNTNQTKAFKDYIDRVNKKTKGKVILTFLGGPEVIPAREQVEALRNGVVDIAISPTAYQMRLVPINQAWSIFADKPWKERKSGLFDLISQGYLRAKMKLLGSMGRGSKMYFFLRKEVKRPGDLKGMKIRTIPNVRTILENLQCKGVTVPRGDIYIAMERGVLDGFLSPIDLVLKLGQQEVCKYWIDHGFLVSVVVTIANVKRWNSLPQDIQKILTETMEEIERDYYSRWFEYGENAKRKLIKAGVKRITFAPADAKKFLDVVRNGFYSDLKKADPQGAAKLMDLMK